MNYLKLTLILCFFSTFLFGQGENPGYVVLMNGDTLLGRVAITYSKIKFRDKNGKKKFDRTEIADYGYYGNKSYFSRPDEITPTSQSKVLSSVVLTVGDTLTNFYLQKIHPDYVIGYFEYPKYISYEAKSEEVIEVIVHDKKEGDVSLDLIQIEGYARRKEPLLIYAERALQNGLEAYNVDSNHPYFVRYVRPEIFSPLTKSILPTSPIGNNAIMGAIKITEHLNQKKAISYDWIIYKNSKSYYIHSYSEWLASFDEIFSNDTGFPEFLVERKIVKSNIQKILEAYGDFQEQKN